MTEYCPEGFELCNQGKHYHYACKKCGMSFCEHDSYWAYHSCRFTMRIWVDSDNEDDIQEILLEALTAAKESGRIKSYDYSHITSEEWNE